MKSHDLRQDLLHLGVITGAALAIGVYLIVTCVLITPDGVFYIRQAQQLTRHTWTVAGQFPPGYPLLLLGIHKLASLFVQSDSVLVWVYSAQAVTLSCRILALVCLYFAGRLLTDARRSFWAVLILTFLPYPAHYGGVVLREWPYLMFLALGFWLLLWSLRSGCWWGFGLVGLAVGLGYLIRPESAQLVVYGVVGLVAAWLSGRRMGRSRSVGAVLALAACFAVVAAPYHLASGTVLPHQLRRSGSNDPPVITSVGGLSASEQVLAFDVSVGRRLELSIEVSDPDGDDVTLTVVAAPHGSRPIYRFRTEATGDCFLIASEREKDRMVVTYRPETHAYDGIAFYAWTEPGAAAGLVPVHRFWSSVGAWHVYTASASRREALLADAEHGWHYEGIAFYAFAPDNAPNDARPICESRSETGAPCWTLDKSDTTSQPEITAWYAHGPADVPAGLGLESATLRWQPGPDQQGEHHLNIIADDGAVQSCQLVRITVGTPEQASATSAPPVAAVEPGPTGQAALMAVPQEPVARRIGQALYEIADAFGADIMYFLIVPLGLGLFRYLKDEAGSCERALTVAVIVVNFGLLLTRYVWVEPGPARRYCLVLVALAMFHVPTGGWVMARWIKAGADFVSHRRLPGSLSERFWFGFLVALALGPMSLPKLLMPPGADKASYRRVAQWLRENTGTEEVIAVPDRRISFYAERQGLTYDQSPDPRRADYIVTISEGNSAHSAPTGWREMHTFEANEGSPSRITVYKTP
ncbi:MAG: glycosyltransferase family 39 protein [Sedimentisphaerales bacterium]|nr:glycosyltransferase family 39 protein [Sedimentisphaerales bacterium]